MRRYAVQAEIKERLPPYWVFPGPRLTGVWQSEDKEVKIKSDTEYEIDEILRDEVRAKVQQLCGRFPMRY